MDITVPVEATAFLGAVAGFVVLLLALFLYLSRKWCFTPPSTTTLFGGVCVPLCEPNNGSTSQITKNIGRLSTNDLILCFLLLTLKLLEKYTHNTDPEAGAIFLYVIPASSPFKDRYQLLCT